MTPLQLSPMALTAGLGAAVLALDEVWHRGDCASHPQFSGDVQHATLGSVAECRKFGGACLLAPMPTRGAGSRASLSSPRLGDGRFGTFLYLLWWQAVVAIVAPHLGQEIVAQLARLLFPCLRGVALQAP